MFPLSYPGDGARLLTENKAGSSPAEGAKLREVNQTGSGLALKAMGTVSSRMEFDSTSLLPVYRVLVSEKFYSLAVIEKGVEKPT